jgi:hypothetical protein
MSIDIQNLLNRAINQMKECAPFTPFEVPAPIWELTPKLIRELADVASKYGLPCIINDDVYQNLFLKTGDKRLISVSFSAPPLFTLMIGDVSEPCFYIIIKVSKTAFGVLVWNKKVTVSDVLESIHDMDHEMISRGLFDPKTNERECALKHAGLFRVSEVFADAAASYKMRKSWSVENILALFDEPEKLVFVSARGARLLCLAESAPFLQSEDSEYIVETVPREDTVFSDFIKQYSPSQYS